MAITFFCWSWLSRRDRRLGPSACLMISYHEEHHRLHWWRLRSREDEFEAERYAYQKMIVCGYSFDECLELTINYRLFDKYGHNLEDFVRRMKKGVML